MKVERMVGELVTTMSIGCLLSFFSCSVTFAEQPKLSKPTTKKIISIDKYNYYIREIDGGLLINPAKHPFSALNTLSGAEWVTIDYLKGLMSGEISRMLDLSTVKKRKYLGKEFSKKYISRSNTKKDLLKKYKGKLLRINKRIDYGRGRESKILICYFIVNEKKKNIESGAIGLAFSKGKWRVDLVKNDFIYKNVMSKGECD